MPRPTGRAAADTRDTLLGHDDRIGPSRHLHREARQPAIELGVPDHAKERGSGLDEHHMLGPDTQPGGRTGSHATRVRGGQHAHGLDRHTIRGDGPRGTGCWCR